jgi:ribosomal protein S19E (S16A)
MSGAAAGLGGSERRITAPHDGAVAKTGAVSDADPASDADEVLIRLAALWGKLAELDPEVAKRLPTYDA